MATSRPRGVQAGLKLIVKSLLTDGKRCGANLPISHRSADACALRPIALAEGVMYRLVLVLASCSLVDKHQVIDDQESSGSVPSFLFQGVLSGTRSRQPHLVRYKCSNTYVMQNLPYWRTPLLE